MKNAIVITSVFIIMALWGCVSKDNIRIPLSPPLFHPELNKMQSTPIKRVGEITKFGDSKRYIKNGVTVVVLKGRPYEVGYARGILLRNEIKDWVQKTIYVIRSRSFGTSIGEQWMYSRATEIEKFIPEDYIDELKGLSAGAGIDYGTILMANTLATIARSFECTSVALKDSDGKLLRSRNQDYLIQNETYNLIRPLMLFFYDVTKGHAFASISPPGLIGVWTAMNEKGVNSGTHAIGGTSMGYREGIPYSILNRILVQYADSLSEAEKILSASSMVYPYMWMITDSSDSGVFEYDGQAFASRMMNEQSYLVLTNHTLKLNLSIKYSDSLVRYDQAEKFLIQHKNNMDVVKLVEMLRLHHISCMHTPLSTVHSAIFRPSTLDFWIAIDAPPAARGRWVGFNLQNEINENGHDPTPAIIPAMENQRGEVLTIGALTRSR